MILADADLLLEADQAERGGDPGAAVTPLRAYLARRGDDEAIRLRLARLLVTLDEPRAARDLLLVVDQAAEPATAARANRLLAALDQSEGALTSAAIRWERVLADDIDDAEAREQLEVLRPRRDERWPIDLSLGTLVAPEGVRTSRFRIIRELGRGATATVFLVRDEPLDLLLALKVLHPQLAAASRARARTRFFAEARVAARLRHPGVVAVYAVDESTGALAMELIAGGTVRDRLRARAAAGQTGVDAEELLATARALLGTLAYVHGAGVVHGDLKPGNLLLRRPGEVVLGDFGGAAWGALDVADDDRSQGTPLYLAPEQFHGAPPSPRTDLFAVGAILWELARGRPARRQTDLIANAAALPPPFPPETFAALGDQGQALRRLIEDLMSPAAAERPASAAAALAALTTAPPA